MALRDENAAIMKAAGTVVWLTAEPETILERVKNDDSRPLLRGTKIQLLSRICWKTPAKI